MTQKKILSIDIGGTHVKVKHSEGDEIRKAESGLEMTAEKMVVTVKEMTQDWQYDVISMGYPGPVLHGKIFHEPHNLGPGWVKFDFAEAFGKPVRIINDAAMQALGSYDGGSMLFLGLGTGLGTALVIDGEVQPMEMGHLPYKKGHTFEDYVGKAGQDRSSRKDGRQDRLSLSPRAKSA
jgi:polyphosphate glucokinase